MLNLRLAVGTALQLWAAHCLASLWLACKLQDAGGEQLAVVLLLASLLRLRFTEWQAANLACIQLVNLNTL